MGDDYSITSSLLVNGLATMISALFGNPFPTTLFIGAPYRDIPMTCRIWKRQALLTPC
jgi:hypothetical protein